MYYMTYIHIYIYLVYATRGPPNVAEAGSTSGGSGTRLLSNYNATDMGVEL